jgi:hypothetical protein
MSATLWAANADEIDDLIIWLENHPDDVDPLSRDAVARWLARLRGLADFKDTGSL